MAPRPVVDFALGPVLVLALSLGACGEGETGGTGSPVAATTDSGQPAIGGPGITGGPAGIGGARGPTAGDSSGGASPAVSSSSVATSDTASGAGVGVPSGATAGAGGEGPSAEGGTGPVGLGGEGGSGGDGSSGRAGSGGEGGVGGPGGAGAGRAGSGGEGGSGGASGDECTRELLDGLLDDYFTALSAGDPSSLPLAANVKFTENAQESEIGTTEFWMNAGDTNHSQRALDTEACSVAAQAVIPEGGMDLPVALRIKVEGAEMTEIETIVVRPGDYTASFAVDSDPAAIIAIADDIGWHDEVPAAERATREQLAAWIDKYFRAFPAGVCDVTGACRRLENGGGDFACGAGASCSADDPGQGGTFVPRVIVVDEVRGIAAGLTIFDFQTTGHLDMHMVKMSGGQVHAVQAILRDTGGQSGWD